MVSRNEARGIPAAYFLTCWWWGGKLHSKPGFSEGGERNDVCSSFPPVFQVCKPVDFVSVAGWRPRQVKDVSLELWERRLSSFLAYFDGRHLSFSRARGGGRPVAGQWALFWAPRSGKGGQCK